jgi:hypothetical protein
MNQHEIFHPQIHRVTQFQLTGNYTILVTFADQTERVIDLEPILSGPLFGPLKDPKLFSQVTLDEDFGALEWPNGADIDPAVLHDWEDHLDAILERRRQTLTAS